MARKKDTEPYFMTIIEARTLQPGMVLVTVGGDTSANGEWEVVSIAREVAEPRRMVAEMKHRMTGKIAVSMIEYDQICAKKIMRDWLLPQDLTAVQPADDVVE